MMRYLISVFVLLLISLNGIAQNEEPIPDYVLDEIRKQTTDYIAFEATTDDSLLPLLNAWKNEDVNFISEQIKKAATQDNLSIEYFLGIALILENEPLSEKEGKTILNVFYALKNQFQNDKNINQFLYAIEIQLAKKYYDVQKIALLNQEILDLMANNAIQLDEETIQHFYSLHLSLLEFKGQLENRKKFAKEFYEKFPIILKTNYLFAQYSLGNYTFITQNVKLGIKEPDPFLLMTLAKSHHQLKNIPLSKICFDELIHRYLTSEPHQKEQGSIAFLYNDDQVGSATLSKDDLIQMISFYLDLNDSKNACIALEWLQHAFENRNFDEQNESQINDYLMNEDRKKLDQEIAIKTAAENENTKQQIKLWNSTCKASK